MRMNLIKRSMDKGGRFQATTLSGQHLLWVCVDDEKLEQYTLESTEIYEQLMVVVYTNAIIQTFFTETQNDLDAMPES